MPSCRIIKAVRGQRGVDGAGVHLVRVLGHGDVTDFDPFLMLDSFDSRNPADYTAGFPTHPHRGIETITYLIEGKIEHEDSLGNRGVIESGEAQWMTAGSGILHQEMPGASPRMLGFQLWLNLPRTEKMAEPAYLGITPAKIPMHPFEQGEIRVLSGAYEGLRGVTPRHLPAAIFDITLKAGREFTLPVNPAETAFVFLIEGDAAVSGQRLTEKTAALLGEGDAVTLGAPGPREARIIFFSGPPLREPVAWGGPIVMNTRQELREAFDELRRGTFIRHG